MLDGVEMAEGEKLKSNILWRNGRFPAGAIPLEVGQIRSFGATAARVTVTKLYVGLDVLICIGRRDMQRSEGRMGRLSRLHPPA